jgi:hypothetical protein
VGFFLPVSILKEIFILYLLVLKFFQKQKNSNPFISDPSTAFVHSDRKNRALTCRHRKTFIQLLSVNSRQIWVTVNAFCDFFRRLFVTSLESIFGLL